MKVGAWLTLLMFAPLAGCLDDATTDDVLLDDTPADVVETFTHEGSYALQVTQATTPVNRGTYFANNCIGFEGETLDLIKSGTAVLEWDALTPLQEELELRVAGDGPDITVVGTSPLEIEFEDLSPHEFFESVLFMAQTDRPGAAAGQEATLTVSFDYEGDEELEVMENGGCAFN